MIRTANPALRAETFTEVARFAQAEKTMTIQGTVGKTAILLVCCVATAVFTWGRFGEAAQAAEGFAAGYAAVQPWLWGGVIGGLVFAWITAFKRTAAPITAPLFAACEGLFLGAVSAWFEALYPGIVLQAVALTLGVLAALLLAYTSRLIKPTENLKLGIVAATGGVFLVYVASWILGFLGVGMPFIHDSGPIGIGFSIVVIIIAALNLVLDFDFIESGAEVGAPKYMEWYGAFGLMVTLVWLYLEILRLLSKLRDH